MTDPLVERLRPFGASIFGTISALAAEHGATNLGQGFPDTPGPPEVLGAAAEAVLRGQNQYPPPCGHAVLREAVSRHRRRFTGLVCDPASEILITAGATEGIASCLLGLVEPGDEVVMFEPYFDIYPALVALAGGHRRTSVLRFPDYAVDEASLRAAFTRRTKVVLLNSPHNPTGKVFTRDELTLIVTLAVEHDAWIVCDEVYEHLVFSGATHVPVASLPGAAGRTLSVGSAGKTFSVTGWKVGWVTGPPEAVTAVASVKQNLTYSGGAPLQPAAAVGLGLPDAYFAGIAADLERRRDVVVDALRLVALPHAVPAGTFFVTADLGGVGVRDAVELCHAMPQRYGLAMIPVAVFHDDPEAATGLVRLTFCKTDETLSLGMERLAAMVADLRR